MVLIDPQALGYILLIFFAAGIVKGVTGFGLPIVSMSFLPLVVPVEQALVLSAIVQPATNLVQLVSGGIVRVAVKTAAPVLITLVPGVTLGAWYLTSLDSGTILLAVGFTIVLFAAINLLGYQIRIPQKQQYPVGLAFGVAAGISGALTTLNGWAFILYLVGIDASRNVFRSAIALMFLVSGFVISSSFWYLGLLDMPLFLTGIATLAVAFPGMWIGNRFGAALPAEGFRKVLLVSLLLMGCWLVYQTI